MLAKQPLACIEADVITVQCGELLRAIPHIVTWGAKSDSLSMLLLQPHCFRGIETSENELRVNPL